MNTEYKLGLNRSQVYWSCQLGGWSLFVFAQGFFLSLKDHFNNEVGLVLLTIFIESILLTQLLRWVIIRRNLLKMSFLNVLPRLLFMNLLMGSIVAFAKSGIELLILHGPMTFDRIKTALDALNFSLFFFLWSVLYYLVHFVENYRQAEIANLKWEAAIKETELNKLKSQLNPHFMFNAMNSIRALVGEDPVKAKEAVTQFSNLLRNTLQVGKHKLIPFSQEMEVVKDYIAIESIRLEERLKVNFDINDDSLSFEVPPLMIQTLVENGIKHGIAKIPEGGRLSVQAFIANEKLNIVILNSGKYDSTIKPESGFGLKNTRERLHLLYNGNFSFSITNINDGTVQTELTIPKFQRT